jgi:hypothetical protein
MKTAASDHPAAKRAPAFLFPHKCDGNITIGLCCAAPQLKGHVVLESGPSRRDPHVALFDPLDQAFGIELPET